MLSVPAASALPDFPSGWRWPTVWGALSGLVVSASECGPLREVYSLIALAPACVGLARCPSRSTALCLSASFAVAWMLPAYSWLDLECLLLLRNRLALWIAIRITACLGVVVVLLLIWSLGRRGWLFCGLLPTVCFGGEQILDRLAREWLGTTIDPLRLGLGQIDHSPFGQAASVGEVSLVSWLVAATNGLVADFALRRFWKLSQRRLACAVIFVIVITAVFGTTRLMSTRSDGCAVAAVPIPFPTMLDDSPPWLTKLSNADLIVFPESALACRFNVEEKCDALVAAWAAGLKRTLVVGGLRTSLDPVGEHVTAAIAYPTQNQLIYSDKRFPVPIFECAPPLARWLGVESPTEWHAGSQRPTGILPGGQRFAVGICHDALFSEWTNDAQFEAVDFLVHISNVRAVCTETAKSRFLKCVQLRAIESGLPILHCSMSGRSCVIDGLGQIVVQQDRENRDAAISGVVPRPVASPWNSNPSGQMTFFLAASMALWTWRTARA